MTKMWHLNSILSVLSVALVFTGGTAGADEKQFSYPPTLELQQVRQWIDKAPSEHPRLLATAAELAALRGSLDADPLRRGLADAVIEQAEFMLDIAPITRTQQGRRLLGQSRRCLKRTITLAMAYHLTGDERFAKRCEEEMLTVARFTDWNPSHFLDVAEMTCGLAIGYDWLYDQLGQASRREIRAAIVDKGVALPFTTRHKGWVRASNNWGQVCHGGLTAGALAVMEDEPDLAARTVHNALHNVTHAMAAYAPAGSYPEGPGYWAYGTGYNVLLIAVLESALGTDFGLTKAPGFDVTGQYPALACGPSGQFFNYADGGARRSHQPSVLWFAARYNRPDWAFGEDERLTRCISSVDRGDAESYSNRFLPLSLLWLREDATPSEIRVPLHWSSRGETPITVHRSSWTDPNSTYVGFKGGSPSANHGQMDIGSFVLDCDGVRWAEDLGAEGYHGIESRGMNLWSRAQNSDRWTIFRQSNAGHNTLVIDGQLQRASGRGEVVGFSDDPRQPHSVIDMSSVYQGQAESVRRGVALLPTGELLIQDHLTGLNPGARVRWGMITRGEPAAMDGTALKLAQEDARLTLNILSSAKAAWQTIDTAEPRNVWDSPNRGTRMVAFEATAGQSGELTLAVLATPGSCADSAKDRLKVRPLGEWSR